MQNEMIRKIVWAGMMAASGALATVAAHQVSEKLYRHLFDEDPPG